MEMKSTTYGLGGTVIKKEQYSDAEDSNDEDLTTMNKINDYSSQLSAYLPATLEEPIKVDPTVMSENAIKLIRTIEQNLASCKTACSSDGKAEIKVEENNSSVENESQADSPEDGKNIIVDPFAGTTLAPVPKYIFGPKPLAKPGLFDCNKCSIHFESLAFLNRHNQQLHVKKPYNPRKPVVCDICDESLKLFPDLVQHRKSRHRMLNPLYQSIIADSDEWVPDSTIGDGNLGYGGNEKSDVPPKYIFGPKPPENEGLFSCHKCSKNLASQENLDRHNLVNHTHKIPNPNKPYVCNVCDKVFNSVRKMMHHKIHLHKIYNPQYKMYMREQNEKTK